jgi:hypothetical protein
MLTSSISSAVTPVLLPAGNSRTALTSVAPGSSNSALLDNVEHASSGVSAAIQSVGSALGSIINTSA